MYFNQGLGVGHFNYWSKSTVSPFCIFLQDFDAKMMNMKNIPLSKPDLKTCISLALQGARPELSANQHLGISFENAVRNCFQFRTIDMVIPSEDLNLGNQRLSLLEFETWQLRPLGHHGRFLYQVYYFRSSPHKLLVPPFMEKQLHDKFCFIAENDIVCFNQISTKKFDKNDSTPALLVQIARVWLKPSVFRKFLQIFKWCSYKKFLAIFCRSSQLHQKTFPEIFLVSTKKYCWFKIFYFTCFV